MSHDHENPADAAFIQLTQSIDLLPVHYRHKQIWMKKHQYAVKIRRRYTEYSKGMFTQLNGPADDAGIVMEMGVPTLITQHGIGSAVQAMLVRTVEEPAQKGLNAQSVEVVSAGFNYPGTVWLFAGIQSYRAYVPS